MARLYGAVRNDAAYGANLRWTENGTLSVEYQEARSETLDRPRVQIGGREVRIVIEVARIGSRRAGGWNVVQS